MNDARKRTLRRAVPAAIALAIAMVIALSPKLRASFRAAFIAFSDPSRVTPSPSQRADSTSPAYDERQADLTGLDDDGNVEPSAADGGLIGDPEKLPPGLVIPELPVPVSPRTARYVRFFATEEKGRRAFVDRYKRAGRYREPIEQALRDADLPEDLLWIAAIVSGMNPEAVSPEGAAGLFQLMPRTAARYGLAMSEIADDRRSLTRGTAAAVEHLTDLFARYGSWDLALAAYNMGYEALDEAIVKYAARRGAKPSEPAPSVEDLAKAKLIPRGTASFVAEVHAFAITAANRGRFDLDHGEVDPPLDSAEILVPGGTQLRLIAQAAGVSVAVLRRHNPDLLRDHVPQGGDVIVLIPADTLARTYAAFPAIYQKEETRRAVAAALASEAAVPLAPPRSSASAKANASAGAGTPPADRFTLSNGVIVERRHATGASVTITPTIELVDPARGRPTGKVIELGAISASPSDLAGALERAAQAIRASATGAGQAAVEARRSAGAPVRAALGKAPYGSSWIALGDKLFSSADHPRHGYALTSPLLPLAALAVATDLDQPALRATVIVAGPVEHAGLKDIAGKALGKALVDESAIEPHPRVDRVALDEPLPSPRIVVGWALPPDGAIARLAMIALVQGQVGRVSRALVTEKHVAVQVRGLLDAGARGSVAAIEAVPAVPHDVADVERELDKAIDAFADKGPSDVELDAYKANVRARLAADKAREKDASKLAAIEARALAVTAEELRAYVQKAFSKDHRVIVVTRPKDR